MLRWLHISDLHFNNDDMSTISLREELPQFLKSSNLLCDYLFAMIYFQEKCKQDNFQEYIDEGCDYIQQLSNLLSELSPEEQEQVRIQVEYEVEFLEGQGFDLNEVAKALPTENE